MKQIGIGLAGLGTVGTGVYRHLKQNCVLIRERLGLELSIQRVAVRDPAIARSVCPPAELVTSRWKR